MEEQGELTAHDVEALLNELYGDGCEAACARVCADGCSLALRVLEFLIGSDQRGAPHLAAERCLNAAVRVCSSSAERDTLVVTLARAGALQRWVYADLQGSSMTAAGTALEFLTLLCGADAPLPPDVTALLGRNLVHWLIDISVDTAGASDRDEAFPPMCCAALLALCAVYNQIALEQDAQEEQAGDNSNSDKEGKRRKCVGG